MRRLLCALPLLIALPLHAQTSCLANPASCSTATGTVQVSITIGRAFQLNIAPATTNLAVPTPAIYDAGYAATTGPTATIRANAAWTLGISALAGTWSATGPDANTSKQSTDLQWATSSSGPFTGVTTTAAPVANNNATASSAIPLYYRTLWSWARDGAGTYSLTVVFTISSP